MARVITMTPTVSAYYIDATGGDDDNEGKSPAEAWQTIAKVNAAAFDPGDLVLFKRGETFAGKLAPVRSGAVGNYITYGAYGAGDRPVIDGSAANALNIINGETYYLRFENIVFSGATGALIPAARVNTHDVYIYNCAFNDSAAGSGYSSNSASGSIIYNITLSQCTMTGNNKSGLFVGSDTGVSGPHDVLISQCTAYSNGTSTSADHGFYVKFGVTVDGCIAYSNMSAGIKVNCETVHDSDLYPIVKNCTSYGNYDGMYVAHEAAIIYNNLIYGNTHTNLQFDGDGDNCTLYFNTVVNCTVGSGSRAISMSGSACVGNVLKNNLFIQDSAVVSLGVLVSSGVTSLADLIANNTFDYNLYYWKGTDTGSGMFYDGSGSGVDTWNEFKALSAALEAHGVNLSAVPGFVTRYTDLHPADDGNLKALGVAISGYELDKDGNTRADPPTPGCYEEAAA